LSAHRVTDLASMHERKHALANAFITAAAAAVNLESQHTPSQHRLLLPISDHPIFLVVTLAPQAEWDVDDCAGCFEYYAKLAEELDARQWSQVDVGDEVRLVQTTPYQSCVLL
jgi:hypothetical protein